MDTIKKHLKKITNNKKSMGILAAILGLLCVLIAYSATNTKNSNPTNTSHSTQKSKAINKSSNKPSSSNKNKESSSSQPSSEQNQTQEQDPSQPQQATPAPQTPPTSTPGSGGYWPPEGDYSRYDGAGGANPSKRWHDDQVEWAEQHGYVDNEQAPSQEDNTQVQDQEDGSAQS